MRTFAGGASASCSCTGTGTTALLLWGPQEELDAMAYVMTCQIDGARRGAVGV